MDKQAIRESFEKLNETIDTAISYTKKSNSLHDVRNNLDDLNRLFHKGMEKVEILMINQAEEKQFNQRQKQQQKYDQEFTETDFV